MPSANTRIARNTLMLYCRTFLTMGISLYTSRVILKVLGVDDFGIFGVVGGIIWMFSFISNSMSGATQRYLTFEIGRKNTVAVNRVFNVSTVVYLLLICIIIGIGETFGLWFVKNKLVIPDGRMSAALWVYQASIFAAVISFLSIPYNALIISYEKMNVFAYISVYEVTAKLGIILILEYINYDKLKLYAILLLLVQISVRIIYQVYCRTHFSVIKLNKKDFWHLSTIKSIASFAGWTLFGNLACVAYTQGVNIVLNMFFGPVVNAARAITAQVETVVKSFVSGFQTAMNPQLVKNYATNNTDQLHLLIYAGCKHSFYLLYILCLPIFLEAPNILGFWLTNVPAHTINFIRIITIVILVETQSNTLATAIGATGKIRRYQLIVGGILLLILPSVYLRLYLGGTPEEAMLIYLAFVILAQIARFWLAGPLIGFSLREYIKEVIIPIFYVLIISAFIPTVLCLFLINSTLSMILVCVTSILFTLLSIYFFGLKKSERNFIDQKISIVLSKIKGSYNETL